MKPTIETRTDTPGSVQRIVMDGGEVQIWYEDFMILGSGQTLEEARLAAVDTVMDIMEQLPRLSPPNKSSSPTPP